MGGGSRLFVVWFLAAVLVRTFLFCTHCFYPGNHYIRFLLVDEPTDPLNFILFEVIVDAPINMIMWKCLLKFLELFPGADDGQRLRQVQVPFAHVDTRVLRKLTHLTELRFGECVWLVVGVD